MNIYTIFWVRFFLLAHPICPFLKFENVRQNTLFIYFQNESESQNIWDKIFKILIASSL
jgi:hypothetical protein